MRCHHESRERFYSLPSLRLQELETRRNYTQGVLGHLYSAWEKERATEVVIEWKRF
jgi:hypothetical protein